MPMRGTFKPCPGDILNGDQNIEFVFHRVENIVGKEKMLVISILSFSRNVSALLFF